MAEVLHLSSEFYFTSCLICLTIAWGCSTSSIFVRYYIKLARWKKAYSCKIRELLPLRSKIPQNNNFSLLNANLKKWKGRSSCKSLLRLSYISQQPIKNHSLKVLLSSSSKISPNNWSPLLVGKKFCVSRVGRCAASEITFVLLNQAFKRLPKSQIARH